MGTPPLPFNSPAYLDENGLNSSWVLEGFYLQLRCKNLLVTGANMKDNFKQILVVDADENACMSLIALLEIQADMHVIGWATSDEEAIWLCEDFQPNIILMDLSIPIMGAAAVVSILRHYHPHIPILVYGDGNPTLADEALAAGAVSHLSKTGSAEVILSEIRAVYQPTPHPA